MRPSVLLILSLMCLDNPCYSFIGTEDDSIYTTDSRIADTTFAVSFPNYSLSREEILALPFRGTQKFLTLFPGVVEQDGQLHVRGGRTGEIGYLVDGFNFTNRFANTEFMTLIPEATEGLQLSSGVFSARFGGANSALALSRLRTGGEQWEFSVDYRTDDFTQSGKKIAGTTAFGYRNVVLIAGGPFLLENLRVFLAGQHNYMRNRDVMFLTPISFNPLSDLFDFRGAGQPLPGLIAFKENFLPNNWAEDNTVQGTLLCDLNPLTLKLGGGYDASQQPNGSEWPNALARIFNQRRNPITKVRSVFLNLQTTYEVSPTIFCDLSASYYNRTSRRVDPDFGDDWQSYMDSIANTRKGFTGFRRRWDGPLPYSIIDHFTFNHENTPNNTYNKNAQQSWSFSGTISTRITDEWHLKLGGSVETWTMRLFDVGSINGFMTYLYGYDGNHPQTFASDDERRVRLARTGRINNFGFDVDGNEVNGGFDAPRTPSFRSAYIESNMELSGFLVNVGLRYEYFAFGHKTIANRENPAFNYQLDAIDETKLIDQVPSEYVLPRISIQYRSRGNTVLHAAYGMAAQAPALNQLYNGNIRISSTISPTSRGGVFLTPVGLFARPERTTLYEIGMSTQLGKTLSLSGRVYVRQMHDLITLEKIGGFYNGFLNDDKATAKGLELSVELARTRGVAARLYSTLSEVRGTNSTPMSSRGIVEQYLPGEDVTDLGRHLLDFNQTHNAKLIVDFVNPDDQHPVFSGFGISAVLNYHSGHNYTALKPRRFWGSSDIWNIGSSELADPRFASPLESTNNSTTPVFFNVDVEISKRFTVGDMNLKAYVAVLNLMNGKQVVNVYPITGSADNDGWLENPLAETINAPGYSDFYRAINLQNRWAYMRATGNDIYGSPRQIHVGISALL